MGRIVLGNAVTSFLVAAVGVLGWALLDDGPLWGPIRVGALMFVLLTVVGSVREWQRFRRSRR